MPKWGADIAAAALRAGMGDPKMPPMRPEPPAMKSPNDAPKALQLIAPPPPTPEAISASNTLWKTLHKSSTWNYSKLFDGTTVSADVQIDAVRWHNELNDGKLTMEDIAEGYKAMTGRELRGIEIDDRIPTASDIQILASQAEAYFKQFRDIAPVAKKATTFATLEKEEKKPRLLMSVPRQPITTSCKSGMDTLHHWCALKQTLESLGAEIIQLDPKRPRATRVDLDEQLEIFTRDPVIVMDDRKIALVPDFAAMKKEGREIPEDPHVPAMVAELRKQGYKIQPYKGRTQGGDVIYDAERKLILVGLDRAGFDVNRCFTADDATAMEELTGCKVIRVKRMAYKFYHLDTAIGQLPGGKYLINPIVTDDATYKEIKTHIGEKNIIELPREEERYCSNLIAVGKTLVMPSCSEALEKQLVDAKFTVVTPEKVGLPAGAWDILNGSVHCMTQQVMRDIKITDKEAYAGVLSSLASADARKKETDLTTDASSLVSFAYHNSRATLRTK